MHEWEVTIRFCETDLLGHVNNSNYFIYMEDARVQFFQTVISSGSAGISY